MKRSKALYETNSDTSENIDPQDIYALDEAYGNGNGHVTSQNSNDAFNDLYPRNWSHGTCTCNQSAGRCREASNFTTNLEQMQSKSFNNVGIGNVKTLKKRKVKKIYLPETEDRATGTLDLSLYKSNTNYQHFNSKKECRRETSKKSDKSVGHNFKRNALNTELSPYIQTKLKYTNPQSGILGKNIIGKRLYNTFSIDNFINATTQINSAELGRARKIKIFKEREVNTETFDNVKLDDSESELSIDLSTVLSNKKANDVSSVDSLVQHVYNLDKQRHNGNFSQISVDPMENILEREYRKMFSEQSRDCVYAKKSVSDSLLRRFEALRGSMSKNVPIRKISSQLTEPNYKDVTVVSDHQTIKSQSNVKKKPLSPLASVILEKGLLEPQASNKKIITHTKTQNAPKKPQSSVVESGNNGVKGKFRLWGKILSTETSLKKSKLKCLKGKTLQVVKSGKISSDKSEVKKDRNKFIFFKKRESAKAIKPKKAITTGRCEIREGLTLRIQKGCPKQNHKVRGIKEIHDNCENEDFPFYSWLDKLKFVDSWSSYIPTYLSLNNKNSSTSNDSSETNILLCKNDTTNTMSSSHKKNNPYSDFAKQYIQAWMIPNIILDGFGKTNIYCNLKCEKYDKKDHDKKPTKSILSKQETVMTEGPYKMYKTIYVGNASVEGKLQSSSGCIRCDIGLECISASKNNSYIRKHSDEKVYNIVNYETPLPSIIASKNMALKQDVTKRNLVTNDVITDMHVKNAKHKQGLAKPKRDGNDAKSLNNNMSCHYNCKSIEDETLMQQNANSISKRDRSGTNDYDAIDSYYPNAKKKLKYAEIYLRKFCHDCVPIDINAMCSNSAVNVHQDMVSSSQNVPVKDIKWKSYPKSPGDIRVSTIFSSCNAAANLSQEINKVKENFNGKKKDKSGTDATIRILPKDSLEVFKKRQLYFNSNKNKWNELSMSVSSLSKRSGNEPPRSVKCHTKHVTISELGSTIQCKRSLILKTTKNEEVKQNFEKGGKMPNKNLIHVKKEEDKSYCERGCNTEPSKDDNDTTTNEKMVDGERVDKSTNMPSASDEEVPQIPKEVTAKSSKFICVHNIPKKQSKEKTEDAGNLIEINLEVQRKQGEDKNKTVGVNNSSETTKKEEKTKGVSNKTKKSKNIAQDNSSKKLRSKNSNTYIKLRIFIKNFNYNKETTSKNPQMCEISKKTPQILQTVSTDRCIKSSDNIRSIYQLNSLNSFATFNDNQNSKSDANLTLLEEQNKENSRNSEISCECVVSSQNSISKQSIALYSKEENIENHRLEINGRTICENFQHSKIAFKTHAYLNPYKKFVSNYKLSNTKTKMICKHSEKYTSAQQAIQRMFECTQELKNNRKRRKMKKPAETARTIKWRRSSHRKSKRSRIERMTQTCKLQLHSFSNNSRGHSQYNNHLYSNKKSDIKFLNYYCEVVLTSSKCRKSKSLICKSQKCLRKMIATTSGPSNFNTYKYHPSVPNLNRGGEYKNSYQEISDHDITQENYCSSSSNINNNGDGNFDLKPILKTDYTNNSPKSSKYNIGESISVERSCSNEKIDIFELTEVKEAVLEMYVMEKKFRNSDLFTALPEFVSEVENNLKDSVIDDYFQVLR